MFNEQPRLRGVEKYHPLFKLNEFSHSFAMGLGKELVYLLATRNSPRVEGSDWEEIFARCIGAQWCPSNVGLDDVVLQQMAWGAKTIKNKTPFDVKLVRLISGRNSPAYSFDVNDVKELPNDELGGKILTIWNSRVAEVRKKFSTVRTVVLIKGDVLSEISVFETETVMYAASEYFWQWNERHNLEGYEKKTKIHRFSWQPHGSQFTIIEDVPEKRLKLRIKRPQLVRQEAVLKSVNFDESWIEIVR